MPSFPRAPEGGVSACVARQANYVFASSEGTPLGYRNLAQRGLKAAADRAGLNSELQPQLTLHDLRHTFGSHLVRQGVDVVSVSRQMGHARPSVTLDLYAHQFAAVQHRGRIEARLSEAFGGIIEQAESI
jgi:integrase